MKTLLHKKNYILILGVWMIFSTFSCKREIVNECPACPVITEISPDHGRGGDIITLEGKNFGKFIETQDKVTVNNQQATLASAPTNSFLKVVVPERSGSGEVLVEINGLRSDRLGEKHFFTYDFVIVSDYQPAQGRSGEKILIFGQFFSEIKEENTVIFSGGTELDPVIGEVSRVQGDSILEVILPEGGISGPVRIEVDGHEALGPTFNFLGETVVSGIEPDHGRLGETLLIQGNNFRDPASYTIIFSPQISVIPSAASTETQLEVQVPEGAESGPVKVLVEGQEQLAGQFTYDLPVLTEMSPKSVKKATVVTLMGNFLGTDPRRIKVFFNDKEAELVGNPSETQVQAIVAPKTGAGKARVEVDGKVAEGPDFTYTHTYTVSTVAGNGQHGTGTDPNGSTFIFPNGITVDDDGNVYVTGNHQIRKVTPDRQVSVLAGEGRQGNTDGVGLNARFNFPMDITYGPDGALYVADRSNGRIRKVTLQGEVSTYMTDLPITYGLDFDSSGNMYLSGGNRIYKIGTTRKLELLAGAIKEGLVNGFGSSARFHGPKRCFGCSQWKHPHCRQF